jgi:hypothetical protein
MKPLHTTISILFLLLVILFANPYVVLANEGNGGQGLEMEVNGIHVTLDSQNEWVRGRNTIVVMLSDEMGMPLTNADVEILITPTSDGHEENATDTMSGMDMGGEQPQESMPGMDMGAPALNTEAPDMPVHDEEIAEPISMLESERGVYTIDTHLEASGEHNVHVMFHVNDQMLQADFVVNVAGTNSKTVVLWSFALVNVALVFSAGRMKKQSINLKGGQ